MNNRNGIVGVCDVVAQCMCIYLDAVRIKVTCKWCVSNVSYGGHWPCLFSPDLFQFVDCAYHPVVQHERLPATNLKQQTSLYLFRQWQTPLNVTFFTLLCHFIRVYAYLLNNELHTQLLLLLLLRKNTIKVTCSTSLNECHATTMTPVAEVAEQRFLVSNKPLLARRITAKTLSAIINQK